MATRLRCLALAAAVFVLIPSAVLAAEREGNSDPGPLVRGLWLVHRFGTSEATNPANDIRTKAVLSKALGKDGVFSAKGLGGLMTDETLSKLTGPDGRLEPAELSSALGGAVPPSRAKLLPDVRAHADYLTTGFDLIDEAHRAASEKLVDWIAANYRPGKPLNIVFVCTGNSRRSILGSTTGNVAATYYGLPEIRFFSGGTAPTAFNSRTVAALKAIGVEVEPTGKEAPRGEPKTENPVYVVRWGEGFETKEFSKLYSDAANPHEGFAALMVCSEADAACPFVRGASLRVSMPYLDPKIYDGGSYETAKYAERRDDMGRMMLSVMMRVRNRLGDAKPAETAGR
jgi:hypothetical protein